ncbi:thaumatin family domain-containing protein [Ditylenchus destructor]|uniref:Thaumatin family domain-containing protein n=1 Tax=Ditylenchus destructor TaxID=166010 RepID=A0AAD4MYH2_9BILA|nr:thaumatin family domain-containing protein [Ditylenchus destructor]
MGKFQYISLTILVSALGSNAVKFTIVNNCEKKVWPGWMAEGKPLVDGGGAELAPGESKTIEIPDGTASARIWPRTGCTGADGSLKCETGDCGPNIKCNGAGGAPPASLAEFTLAKDKSGQDTYDTSYVDGYNEARKKEIMLLRQLFGQFDCYCKRCLVDPYIQATSPSEPAQLPGH